MIYSWPIVVGDRCLTGSFHVEEALLGNLHTDCHDALDGLVAVTLFLWRHGTVTQP